jgi:hypothetical protein
MLKSGNQHPKEFLIDAKEQKQPVLYFHPEGMADSSRGSSAAKTPGTSVPPQFSASRMRCRKTQDLPRWNNRSDKSWQHSKGRSEMGSTFTSLHFHIVFSTKNRHRIIARKLDQRFPRLHWRYCARAWRRSGTSWRRRGSCASTRQPETDPLFG